MSYFPHFPILLHCKSGIFGRFLEDSLQLFWPVICLLAAYCHICRHLHSVYIAKTRFLEDFWKIYWARKRLFLSCFSPKNERFPRTSKTRFWDVKFKHENGSKVIFTVLNPILNFKGAWKTTFLGYTSRNVKKGYFPCVFNEKELVNQETYWTCNFRGKIDHF